MALPNTAQATQNSSITTPARNVGLRSSSRQDVSSPERSARATATPAAGGAAMSVIRCSRGAAAG